MLKRGENYALICKIKFDLIQNKFISYSTIYV